MRETRTLEFKETIINTFLKTVSAFSNYVGGEILFGIDDNGNVKGLSDVKQSCECILPSGICGNFRHGNFQNQTVLRRWTEKTGF